MNFLLKLANDYSGQVIWSVVLDHLEQFKGLNQFRSKILCFPEKGVTGTISLRVRFGSHIDDDDDDNLFMDRSKRP